MDLLQKLQQMRNEGVLRELKPLECSGCYIYMEGRTLLNLSSNDYLGLARDPSVRASFPYLDYAMSASSSRLLVGDTPIYQLLEETLSESYTAPSALVWGSGYHANSGILPSLALLDRILILADRLVHASLIDGIRLSRAPFMRFRHNDVEHLKYLIDRYASDYEAVWIVTESLFSMDGDYAPLDEIIALKDLYPNVFLYLDEAHSIGCVGTEGLGLATHLDLLDRVDVLVGTFGKALGSLGAFSLQSKELKSLFISTSRPFIFTTALPPIIIGWSLHLFQVMKSMEDRRAHLRTLSSLLATELGQPKGSHIIPIHVSGGVEACERKAQILLEEGYYVRAIRKPTVPEGKERLRLSLSSDMTREEITTLSKVLNNVL